MAASPLLFRARNSSSAAATHARSFDTDTCPDAATGVQVDDRRARIPDRIPGTAIVGPADDRHARVPRLFPSPPAIPPVRHTTENEFPKSARITGGLASSESPFPKLSVSLAVAGVVGAVEKLSSTFPSTVGKAAQRFAFSILAAASTMLPSSRSP